MHPMIFLTFFYVINALIHISFALDNSY